MFGFYIAGLCLDSLGSSCLPKKTKVEIHPITVYVNSTPYCTSIELEHHRGPCRCECSLGPASCSARQHFLPDSCSCQCLPHLTRDKLDCLNSTAHIWDSDNCQCSCRQISVCSPGMVFNPATCSCQLAVSRQCDHPGNINTYKVYMMNVILMGVLVIIIISTIYWLLCKDSSRRAQVFSIFGWWRGEGKLCKYSSGTTTTSTGTPGRTSCRARRTSSLTQPLAPSTRQKLGRKMERRDKLSISSQCKDQTKSSSALLLPLNRISELISCTLEIKFVFMFLLVSISNFHCTGILS